METRKIGSLAVSVVGLGCNNFGGRLDAAATARVLDEALNAGINLLDTADIYGATRSEEFIGQWLGPHRGQVVLATKFGIRIDDARPGGGRPEYVHRAAEDSLRRLRTDVIDLYQLHRPDPEIPIADTLGAMNELVQAGKVRQIGCSNFSVAQLREAKEAAGTGAQFVSVQNEYSLLKREPEEDGVLAECEREGLGFLPYFPLASGLLSGKYRKGAAPPEGTRLSDPSRFATLEEEGKLDKVERLRAFADGKGHTILELAISWLLARGAVASVIAGATKTEQIRANVAAAGWRLSADDLAAVDAALAG